MKSKSNMTVKPRAYDKQYKVMSILLFSFSILLMLALISYTNKDDESAGVSFFELFGLLTGDPIIEAKAATTQNWLGLFGAWISYILYNKTVGFALVPLPLFIIAWTRYLFSGKKVSDLLLKNTTVYFVMTILFSGLMGSMMTFEHLADISREWSGSIGQFLASVFSGLLGSVGSVILFISSMLITLYLGTDIKFESFYNSIIKWTLSLKKSFYDYYSDKESKNSDSNEPEVSDDKNANEPSDVNQPDLNYNNNEFSQGYKTEKTIVLPIPEPVHIISRKPTIIINKSAHKDAANPFLASDKSEKAVESSANQDKPVSNIPAIPEFKPNFKHVDEDSFSSLDVADNSDDESSDKIENTNFKNNLSENSGENIPKTIVEMETKAPELTISKNVIEEHEPIDILDVQRVIENSQPPQNIKEITPKSVLIDSFENKIEPTPEPKTLTVQLNKIPIERGPVNLIGTSIHDENIKYTYPGTEFLNCERAESFVDEKELTMNAQILQEKLETFKIYIENLSVTPGPVVTQYEFVPAAGIKISKIESLSDDLAMALKAKGIRIIAPIPGKGTIGIEIPNSNPAIVRFGETVNSPKFRNSDAKLPLVLGKNISGEIYVIDLAKMPHLLIAGSTGAGKSVGINTIISSLVYKMHPSELKFVMIDPKKVELQSYSKLRHHFMAASPEVNDTIITKPEDAVTILKAAVAEMELRYDILASVRQRNISDYNQKVRQGAFADNKDMIHKPMPYIVVIIDELADLMLIASKEIEEPITRLAQMARAIGIHLVVATQRPSVDVITGVIKANFPARMAYLVTSKIDSRTILDMQGADQLLGQGDMLCLPPGSSKPVRIQNSFISTDEVESLCDFIGDQEGYSEPYYLPSLVEKNEGIALYDPHDRDPLFEEAARLTIRHQQGSVSLIQRRLKVGYARAGRIVDELENAGILGPFDGSKARLVLLESEADLERIL